MLESCLLHLSACLESQHSAEQHGKNSWLKSSLLFSASSTKTYLTCIIYYKISKTNTRLKQILICKIRWKVELDGEVLNSAHWSQSLEARVIQNFAVLTNKSVTWRHWSWDCTLKQHFPLTLKSVIKPRHSSGREKKSYTANFTASCTDKFYIQVLL